MPTNHPNATYYELLVAQKISFDLSIRSNVSNRDVEDARLAANSQRSREEERAPIAASTIARHASRELGDPLVRVEWSGGGRRSATGDAADLRLHSCGAATVSYQLKSVGGKGLGTLRNPYATTLFGKLNLSTQCLDDALAAANRLLASGDLPEQASWAQLYRTSKALPANVKTGLKSQFQPAKGKMCSAVCSGFNALPPDERANLCLDLMGIVPGQRLFLSLHNDAGFKILAHRDLKTRIAQRELTATPDPGGNSLKIGEGEREYFRLNASASNTQGMSPPCFRVFYLPDAEGLLLEVS